jgi:predicted AAA+ superfamily ATPase
MIKRSIESKLKRALKDSPVVFLNGARQVGKSTLVKSIGQADARTYITLDEIANLSAASSDPSGFVNSHSKPLVIDEVQRVPELFLAIKAEVDRTRKPGRFLLTGSANVLLLPRLAESLAGRMEILTLCPLSQGEIEGKEETFVDALFGGGSLHFPAPALSRTNLVKRIITGGYPEVLARESEERRNAWFGAYVTTILQRDIRDIAHIDGIAALPKLFSLLASRAASLLNIADISNSIAIPQTTLKRYLALLETTYLIKLLPAWSSNIGKRLIKTPKTLLSDSGLLVYLLGVDERYLHQQTTALGAVIENFAAMELTKQITWSSTQPQLYHFRTLRGQEVDLVLQDRRGRVVGIEVKSSSTVTANEFKNLKILAEIAGKNFHRGIVLYTGSTVVPFGERLHAVPIQGLWNL